MKLNVLKNCATSGLTPRVKSLGNVFGINAVFFGIGLNSTVKSPRKSRHFENSTLHIGGWHEDGTYPSFDCN